MTAKTIFISALNRKTRRRGSINNSRNLENRRLALVSSLQESCKPLVELVNFVKSKMVSFRPRGEWPSPSEANEASHTVATATPTSLAKLGRRFQTPKKG